VRPASGGGDWLHGVSVACGAENEDVGVVADEDVDARFVVMVNARSSR